MALTAALLYRTFGKKWLLICAIVAEAPMVVGYWLYDALLTALSSGAAFGLCLAGSAAGIPSNLAQAAFGAAVSTLLALALRRSGYVKKRFPDF